MTSSVCKKYRISMYLCEIVVYFKLRCRIEVLDWKKIGVEERNDPFVYGLRWYLNRRITCWKGEDKKLNFLEFWRRYITLWITWFLDIVHRSIRLEVHAILPTDSWPLERTLLACAWRCVSLEHQAIDTVQKPRNPEKIFNIFSANANDIQSGRKIYGQTYGK